MIDVDTGNDIAALVVENFPDLKATDISSAYFWVLFFISSTPSIALWTFSTVHLLEFRKLN